jgi:hypothetical protein
LPLIATYGCFVPGRSVTEIVRMPKYVRIESVTTPCPDTVAETSCRKGSSSDQSRAFGMRSSVRATVAPRLIRCVAAGAPAAFVATTRSVRSRGAGSARRASTTATPRRRSGVKWSDASGAPPRASRYTVCHMPRACP